MVAQEVELLSSSHYRDMDRDIQWRLRKRYRLTTAVPNKQTSRAYLTTWLLAY